MSNDLGVLHNSEPCASGPLVLSSSVGDALLSVSVPSSDDSSSQESSSTSGELGSGS